MKLTLLIGTVALALSVTVAQAAENPAEVDAVVAATKAANPDVCKSGPAGIQTAVTAQVRTLAGQGKIKGNPQAVGAEAGQKLGRSCMGG